MRCSNKPACLPQRTPLHAQPDPCTIRPSAFACRIGCGFDLGPVHPAAADRRIHHSLRSWSCCLRLSACGACGPRRQGDAARPCGCWHLGADVCCPELCGHDPQHPVAQPDKCRKLLHDLRHRPLCRGAGGQAGSGRTDGPRHLSGCHGRLRRYCRDDVRRGAVGGGFWGTCLR